MWERRPLYSVVLQAAPRSLGPWRDPADVCTRGVRAGGGSCPEVGVQSRLSRQPWGTMLPGPGLQCSPRHSQQGGQRHGGLKNFGSVRLCV